MRFNRLRAHNMGVFSDFELDLNAAPGPLVALVGANGSGKSTALELLFGSVYRECPTRGSLADLATARDSFVEVQVSNGRDYTFRQVVDATSRKGETLITNGTGEPVISSTKVRDADAWVAQHMPAKDTILSSLFCAQQSSGFLGMQPGERKSVLLKLIGVEKLERMAEEARERARTQKAIVATLAARLADERARGGDAVALESALAEARREAEGAEAGATVARQRLADARAAAAAWKAACDAYDVAARAYDDQRRRRDAAAEQLRELEERAAGLRASSAEEPTIAAELEHKRSRLAQADQGIQASTAAVATSREALADARRQAAALAELEEQRSALQGRLDTATAKLADLETRIRNNEAVLAERPAIEAAVAELARLQEEEQAAQRDAAQADSDARVAAQQGEEALRAGAAQQARALQERARVGRLRLALSRAEEVEAASRCLHGLRRDVAAAESEVASAERVLEELRGRHVSDATDRILGLRAGLAKIADVRVAGDGWHAGVATSTLSADDDARRSASELPQTITLAASRVARAREREQKARAALQETEATAALAERLDADRAALAEAEQAVEAAAEAEAEAEQARAAAVRQAATYRGARDGYLERAAALAAQAEELRPLASRAGPLANAESLLAERRPAAEAARAEVAGLMDERAALESRISTAPLPDVARAELVAASAAESLASAERARAELADALPGVEARLSDARGAAARLAELDPQIARSLAELEGMGEPGPAPEPPPARCPDADSAAVAAREAEEKARQAAQAVAVAEARLTGARESAERASGLEAELEAAERDLADWNRLAADLGRDGLQAAEIDAAGPELTELVNDLLHRCHGPRFTVSIETQRLSADGKRTLEGCEVRVLDTERGRDTTAETLSGGEAVLVGEAVSLALAMLACRRAGVERPTIVRDESGSALSPENARVYVSMLRRAAELVDADKVLLVSHTPEVWDLCDARVELGASP